MFASRKETLDNNIVIHIKRKGLYAYDSLNLTYFLFVDGSR